MDDLNRDFRSDTVTQPTQAMKEAMNLAELGDDVYGEDPTINRLQDMVAKLTGFEAALLFPSGSMANLTALMNHAQPGTVLYAGASSHVKLYEMGGYARVAGLSLMEVDDTGGLLDLQGLTKVWSPDIYYLPNAGVVSVENTHNLLGGLIYPERDLAELSAFVHQRGVKVHMDGARLWHAARARQKPLSHWTRHVDSVMLSISKGLGAPVGSVLAGSKDFIEKARATRKLLGGGMRQAGILAAAGIHAVEHHFARLDQDHERCKHVAGELSRIPGWQVTPPQTNILIVKLPKAFGAELAHAVQEATGCRFLAMKPDTIRLVFHQHIDDEACEAVVNAMNDWEPRA